MNRRPFVADLVFDNTIAVSTGITKNDTTAQRTSHDERDTLAPDNFAINGSNTDSEMYV
jgi:hypothetical protein